MLPRNEPDVEINMPVSNLIEEPAIVPEYSSLKRSLSRVTPSSLIENATNTSHLDGAPIRRHRSSASAGSGFIDLHTPNAADIALAAMQYLPTPLIVLSSLKTVVLANEAMGRLLGLSGQTEDYLGSKLSATDILRGQTLSQIGVDMISDGVPVWVSWEKYLDNLASQVPEASQRETSSEKLYDIRSGDTTPIAFNEDSHDKSTELVPDRGRSPHRDNAMVQDTIVDVVVSTQNFRPHPQKLPKVRSPGIQATCRMIISIWSIDNQRYFTLSFTSPPARKSSKSSSHAHVVPRTASSTSSTRSSRSSQSHTPTSSTSSSVVVSPSENTHTNAAFPPTGAPAKSTSPSTITDFQKITRMKDAMLNAMHIPVLAMWRDESVVLPNPAARRLLAVSADPTSEESYDFMSRFKPWSADFTRELQEIDNPMIALCRTQKAFTRWQIGLINERTGKKSNYDVSGHPVFDEKTGEFCAGLVAFKDVTEYTEKLATQNAENEEQFQLICDMMPQMLWTTRPDGYHDYFSQRWYDYTGLTPANSLGLGWKLPFHDEDMPETSRRWSHSLATGEEYRTEYRCRRHDGVWRWMLGRALPLRDLKTGEILKWFGTCTDIQDIIDAREAGERVRQQLLNVLQHSQMNMWIVGRDEVITFFEGSYLEGVSSTKSQTKMVGMSVYDVIKGHTDQKFVEDLRAAIRRVLNGDSEFEVYEQSTNNRWFRSRLVPLRGVRGANGVVDQTIVEGVVGIGSDVTQLRRKEQENIKLLADESAAKEASKMKSNFLANMSHEIRTPIAGVLGMSELLMDTTLDLEQSDYAQNIQRSANSLLTVINDILDFSKIESGRLDIEEVQFSLGVVLRDVAKMLSYAARRKQLQFDSHLELGAAGDLVLLGDPGRIRQILTNLLTNSIKFTSDGYVKLTARVLKDDSDTTVVEFGVEDTGIGIEEEVKKRLFKPFSQADSSTARRFGGTGLGLTICKNLVDLMHGTIQLESKLDCGTQAIFTIPFKKPEFIAGSSAPLIEIGTLPDRLQSELSVSCKDSTKDEMKPPRIHSPSFHSPKSSISMVGQRASLPPAAMSAATEPEDAPIQRDDFHVLVVEDNPVNQHIATKFIQSLKFSVAAVWNGKEALEYLLMASNPDLTPEEAQKFKLPSLILMDVQMPILDGYRTTHMLRHHAPYTSIEAINQIPIVAMTASAIQGDREKCERAGMDDYLAKPVKRAVLEKMILKWITAHREKRRSSLTVVDHVKPALTRAETDHSSNCAENDEIANGFLSVHPAMREMDHLPALRPPLSQGRLSNPREMRRSSLSNSYLAPGHGGSESESDRVMRRVEAEDKAQSLRDAKLLSATESEPRASPSALGSNSLSMESAFDFGSVRSPIPQSYPNQGSSEFEGGILALTEANVEKFNHQDDVDGDETIDSEITLPGPPPELEAPAPVKVDNESFPVWTDSKLSVRPTLQRTALGGLRPDQRRASDRSTSTAKP